MLKVPRSNSLRRRVSMPAIRRAFNTWKRWPRSGWNRWRISAHPKCDLPSGAVSADRRDAKRSHPSVRLGDFHPPHRLRLIGPAQQLLPDGCPMLFQKRWQLLDGHPIHPRASFSCDFTSIRLSRGLSPPSCRTCSAHNKKPPALRRGLMLKQQGSAYRLTWRLVPPPGAPVPESPSETTFTQSESLPL